MIRAVHRPPPSVLVGSALAPLLVAAALVFLLLPPVPNAFGVAVEVQPHTPYHGTSSFASAGASADGGPTHVPTVHQIGPSRMGPAVSSPASPNAISCPTPINTPNWGSTPSFFFNDVQVQFTVPRDPLLDGSQFQTVPCLNLIPMYDNGIWVNLTTNVHLIQVLLTVWCITWPVPGNPFPPCSSFQPQSPVSFGVPIHTNPATNESNGSFFLDIYRYFLPGTTVFFNMTVVTDNTIVRPSTIYSASNVSEPETFQGVTDNATWKFQVESPWVSDNFLQDIAITTTPPVLTNPAYDPNPTQPVWITITSLNSTGGQPGNAIPYAIVFATLVGQSAGSGSYEFSPTNHSIQTAGPIGPYPATTFEFNITAYLPWRGGEVDPIYSPEYSFNWTTTGGWWHPGGGLNDNLEVNMTPDDLRNGQVAFLPSATPVNITLHEPIPNVTISSADLVFHFTTPAGWLAGSLGFHALSPNTTSVTIPGLPPGGNLTFFLVARDLNNNPISSGNYTYYENGPADTNIVTSSEGLLFTEGVDLCTGELISSLPYGLTNSTWSQDATGGTMGFGAPSLGALWDYLPLSPGSYNVWGSQFGETGRGTISVTTGTPAVVVLYFASCSAIPSNVNGNPATLPLPIVAIVGLIAGSLVSVPIFVWYMKIRNIREAEQRRVTL